MLDSIIVIGIVVIVAAWAGRSFYRTLTGKNDGCGCSSGGCHGCACKDSTNRPENGMPANDNP